MIILDAAPSEVSEITAVQLSLIPLSFTHWKSSRFLESFNVMLLLWTVDGEKSKSLPIVLMSLICCQTADSRSSRPFLDAAFVPNHNYNQPLTSPVWNPSLFYQFSWLLAISCPVPNPCWKVLQVWMTGKAVDLLMKWSRPEKTWNILCSCCLHWNTSLGKFRNPYFYLLFHTVPTFWFWVVYAW